MNSRRLTFAVLLIILILTGISQVLTLFFVQSVGKDISNQYENLVNDLFAQDNHLAKTSFQIVTFIECYIEPPLADGTRDRAALAESGRRIVSFASFLRDPPQVTGRSVMRDDPLFVEERMSAAFGSFSEIRAELNGLLEKLSLADRDVEYREVLDQFLVKSVQFSKVIANFSAILHQLEDMYYVYLRDSTNRELDFQRVTFYISASILVLFGAIFALFVRHERLARLSVIRQNDQLEVAISRRTRELQESEQKYRSLFENMQNAFALNEIVTDTQNRPVDYRFLEVNRAFEEQTGLEREDIIGRNATEVLPGIEHDSADWIGTFGEVALTGTPQAFEHYSASLQRWLSVVAYSPGRRKFATLSADITEHRRAEATLSEAYDIINRSPVTVFLWNNDSTWSVEFVSDNVKDLFGFTREEFASGNAQYSSAVHPEDLARVTEEMLSHSADPGLVAFTHEPYRIVTKEGEVKWIEDNTFARRDGDGNITHYEGIVVDISERVRAAEALKESEEKLRQAQKLESVGRLAGGIAHDFNNLLTTIIGHTDLISDERQLSEDTIESLQEIRHSADRAAVLTQQLLAFSRRQMLQPRNLELDQLVSSLGKSLERLIGEHIELTTMLDSAPEHIRADPRQIEQIVTNLVANAGDAMPKGGALTIGTQRVHLDEGDQQRPPEAPPGRYVLLTVSDTGHGMDEQTMGQVFEPFFTTKGVGKGTGLGLSTVYGIVSQSGGFIQVVSEPHRGTTFRLYFPSVADTDREEDTG
jgi:PAS domain S-box-containing protein